MRCVNGPSCSSWHHQEGHRHLWPSSSTCTSSGCGRARRSHRVSRQRLQLQPCAAIEQDMETAPAHLRSLAQNGHGLLDISDATLELRGSPGPESVPLRKRINRMIKKVGSVLEMRVLLEQEASAFDAVNTSHALNKLSKLHATLTQQLRNAGFLSPDTAQQRSEHVAPCLAILDSLVRSNIDQFEAWDVALSLSAYSSLGHYDRQLFELLCSNGVLVAKDMKPVDCAHILMAFGRWGHYHPELLKCIPQVLFGHLYEARPQEISNVLWGFGRLRIPGAPGRQFLLAVCGEVDKNMSNYPSQELVTVLWALVKLQLYPGIAFLQKCESILLQRLRSSSHVNGSTAASLAMTLRHTSSGQQQASLNGHQYHHSQHSLNGSQQHSMNGSQQYQVHSDEAAHHQQPQDELESFHSNGFHGHSNGHSNGWVSSGVHHTLPHHLGFGHQDSIAASHDFSQHHSLRGQPAPHVALKPQDIAMALWSFGKLRYKAALLLDEVPLTLGASLHKYSALDLCSLLAGYADARHYHAGVLEAVAPMLAHRLHHLQVPELMTLLTSYAMFQHRPKSEPQLFGFIAEALEARIRGFKPQTYALAAKSYGNLQYRPDSLLSSLVQGALARLPDFKPVEVAHLLYGLSYLVSQAPHCRLPGVAPSSSPAAARPRRNGVPIGASTPASPPGAVSEVSTGLHPALQPEQMQLFYAAVRQCIHLLDDPQHPYANPKHLNFKVLNSIIHSCMRVGYTPWALIEQAESKGLRVFSPAPPRKQPAAVQLGASTSNSSNNSTASAAAFVSMDSSSSSSSSSSTSQRNAAGATISVAAADDHTAEQHIEAPPKARVTLPGQARRGQFAPPPPEFETKPYSGRGRSAALTRQRPMLFPDRDDQTVSSQDNGPQLETVNELAHDGPSWELQPGPQHVYLRDAVDPLASNDAGLARSLPPILRVTTAPLNGAH